MRPQQQNRRMRGRNNGGNNNNNNNNRKGPNPLTRSYESNGPDVKIRGSAQQIAEKYATLARDAQSSGDRVMAENYLQHAEHYNRIIAAAQAQLAQHQMQQVRDDTDEELDDDGYPIEVGFSGSEQQPQGYGHQAQPQQNNTVANGVGPQPVIEGTPAEVALAGESGQPQERRRHQDRDRERRPYQQNNQSSQRQHGQNGYPAQPSQAAEAGEQAAEAKADIAQADATQAAPQQDEPGPQAAPRRGRRPRRSNRGADQAEGDESGAAPEGDAPLFASAD